MMNLEAFERLDRVIHERNRLAIMTVLAAAESLAFKELKELLQMTDGNLCVHLRALEESGYVSARKSFVNRKPRTDYALTEEGRRAFQEYIQTMAEIVRLSQSVEESQAAAAREAPPALQPGLAPAK
jgi:DNA-binding HxlR family transcriptional regulator